MAGVGMAISTFDVFDTVLTRRVGNPRSMFLLLGRRASVRGHISCSAHAFATARRSGEQLAFRNAGGLDSSVSLRDIYHEVGDALDLNAAQISILVELELELEREMLVPLPAAAARVAAARAAGRRIVYVSDMYLSSEFLRETLSKFGLILDDELLLVSNELQRSKATGEMWNYVCEQFPNTDIVHCGNDAVSDGRRARRAGIRATVLSDYNLNRYELSLEEHHGATDGLASALAGASRIARLNPVEPGRTPLTDVAAGVVAPFVIGNVLWTLRAAKKQGITKLFFVARDGQVLCDVARTLAPKVGYTGDLEYIYGSRQAWCLASHSPENPSALDALVPTGTDVDATLRETLARLDLAPEALDGTFTARFSASTWDRTLAPGDAEALRTLLGSDSPLRDQLNNAAKAARELVLGYLDQVGAITDQPIGFVDLGTGASLYNALSAIVGSVGQAPPTGFYFGLRSHLPETSFGRPMTYVRNAERGIGYLQTPGLLTFVELACTANHGSVLGYRDDGAGRIEPTFSDDDNSAVVDWGLPLVHATVLRVAEELVLDDDLIGSDSIDLRPAILDVFDLFWKSPTSQEATTWGAYPFEDGWGLHAVRNPLAARRHIHHALAPQPHRHWWNGGAKQLSGPITRIAFDSRNALQAAQQKVSKRLSGGSR